jgi:hypothetical protein
MKKRRNDMNENCVGDFSHGDREWGQSDGINILFQ